MEPESRERLRGLPGVDAVARILASEALPASLEVATRMIRLVLEEARRGILEGGPGPGIPGDAGGAAEAVAGVVRRRLRELARPGPERVINATGVMIHTNLGRSPLSEGAIRHLAEVAGGYSDLEYDLAEGERGSRQDHVADLLRLICGAEDALVVNNNAAAVLLVLAGLARGRDVILSRGQLVEIGGSFRIPDVLAESGARLREVGTTNRTHARDYESAMGPETGLILLVHASNYRIEGFTASVGLDVLVELGRRHGVPVAVDLGSGALADVSEAGTSREPMVVEALAQGADVVTFSGDKLLGGPQAGVIAGRHEVIRRLRAHPLARALRVDKLLLAGLVATLVAHLDPARAREEIPVLRMLHAPAEEIRARAERLGAALRERWKGPGGIDTVPTVAPVGGGSLPGEGVASWAVRVDPRPGGTAARLERELRRGRTALVARIEEDAVLLDLRTVAAVEEGMVADLVLEARDRMAVERG